jgi:hypothetical protein
MTRKYTLKILTSSIYAVLLLGLTGCANVVVKKIPNKADYSNGLFDQAGADAIEGNRYYLPRPYIAVSKEFPYRSSSIFVHGFLSGDGATVRVTEDILTTEGDSQRTLIYGEGAKIPTFRIFIGKEGSQNIALQGNANDQDGSPQPEGDTAQNWSNIASLALIDSLVDWNAATTFQISGGKAVVHLKFKVKKEGKIGDTSKRSVREILLFKVEKGLPVSTAKYSLPMEFYKDDGSYEYKGVLQALESGKYVIGLSFLKQNGSACDVFPMAENPSSQKFIDIGTSNAETNIGADFKFSDVRGFQNSKGMTYNSAIKLTNNEKPLIGISLDIADIKKTDAGNDISAISGIGLVQQLDDGSLIFDNSMKLPLEAGKLDDDKKKFTYYLNSNLQSQLAKGKYVLYVYFSSDSSPAYVYTDRPVLEVQSFTPNEYPTPICKIVEKPQQTNAPSPANPNPSNGNQQDSSANSDVSTETPAVEPKEKSSTKVEEKMKAGGGLLNVVATSNPDTKPVIDINDYFKLLYLPDFQEQYAIKADANLSTSEVAISLENGWLMENFASKVDNRAIANFFFLQFGETLDLVRDIVRIDKQLLAPILPSSDTDDSDTASLQSSSNDVPVTARVVELPEIPVLLKIHSMSYAIPGIYPILKPKEMVGGFGVNKSVVQFDQRNDVIIELISFGNQTNESKK